MTEPADHIKRAVAHAEILIDLGRCDQALPLLQRAIAASPDDARIRCLYALALLHLGDAQGALTAAEQAIHVNPQEEWAHRVRSSALLQLGRMLDALEAAREAVRLAPEGPRALYTLCKMLLRCYRMDEACEVADALCRVAPEWPESHGMAGCVALEIDQLQRAEDHYLRALELEPNNADTLNDLGVVLLKQGRVEEAVGRFHDALGFGPTSRLMQENLEGALDRHLRLPGIPPVIYAVFLIFGLLRPAIALPAAVTGLVIHLIDRIERAAKLRRLRPAVSSYYRQRRGFPGLQVYRRLLGRIETAIVRSRAG